MYFGHQKDVRLVRVKNLVLTLVLVAIMASPAVAFLPQASAQTTTEAPKVFRLGMFDQPDSLSPVLGGSVAAWEFYNWIYDPLIRWDDNWGVKGGLAESWEWAANGSQLTLNLVQNATWHDGTPFTSADVNWTLFTWTWLGWWAGQTYRIDHRNIKCPDSHTVVLNFVDCGYESIWAWAPAPQYAYYRDSYNGTPVVVNKEYLLTGLTYIPILPKHLWDPITWHDPVYGLNGSYYASYNYTFWSFGNWDGISWNIIYPTFAAPHVGTGPFKLTTYEPGEVAIFEANADYQWGRPIIDNLTVLFYTSIETMTQAVKSGEIDFCETSANFIETGVWGPEVTKNINSWLGWDAILINQDWIYANSTGKFQLREPAVKDAINQAVNKTKVANIAYLGHATAEDSVVHKDLKWHNDNMTKRTSGAAAAMATLEAAGWAKNLDGIYEKTMNATTKSLTFTIKIVSGDPIDLSAAQLIKADLEAAGFAITIQAEDVSTFSDDLGAYNYDMMITFYTQIADPNTIAQYMTSASWLNPTMLNVPRVDEIYNLQQLVSDTERAQLFDELQQLVYDEGSVCVLVNFDDIEIYRNDRYSFTHEDWLSGILSIWNWESWLEADEVAPPAPIPIELILIGAGAAIVVVVVLLAWRAKH